MKRNGPIKVVAPHVESLPITPRPILAPDATTMISVSLGRADKPTAPSSSALPIASETIVSDLATVRNLHAWSRQRVNLSEIGVLQLPEARVTPQGSARIAWQLRRASEICYRQRASGLGLAARASSDLIRGFACSDGAVTLLVNHTGSVAASPIGLLLHIHGPPDTTLLVDGWRITNDGVVASTRDGELELPADRGGSLLAELAPSLHEAIVRPVALRTVFSGLFIGLVDLATLASESGRPMQIKHRTSYPG